MNRIRTSSMQALESRVFMSSVVVAVADVVAPSPTTNAGLMALGKFNADGLADQASVRRLPSLTGSVIEVTLSKGAGNGTFAKSDVAVVNGYTASAVTVGDVNNDGKADVVFIGATVPSPTAAGGPKVFAVAVLGNGQGGFIRGNTQAPVVMRIGIPKLEGGTSVAVGDFNGDSLNDVAGLGKSLVQSSPTGPTALRTTIVVAWASPMLLPVILPPTVVVPAGNPAVDALFAGDVDGDKKADLVAAKRVATPLVPAGGSVAVVPPPDLVTVRFPTADRQKPAVLVSVNPLYRQPPIVSPTTAVVAPMPLWRDMETFGLADIDGNGTADLVGRRGSTVLMSSWRNSTTTGGFAPAVTLRSYGTVPELTFSQSLLGDIDGDNRSDILSSTSAGRYLGRNTPTNIGGPAIVWSKVPVNVIAVATARRS